MPLFKKNRDEFSGNNAAGYDGNNNLNNQRYDGTQDNFAGGRGAGVGSQHHHDPLYPSPNAPTATQNMPRGAGAGTGAGQWDDNYNGAQPGMGAASGATAPGSNAQAAEYPMRPQTDASGNPINPAHSTGGGGGKRLEGKVERVVGTMIGSQSLKAKGLAKEQEAAALKAQASELTEAERLEQAALARRERAVAHGAHPDHRHLGGHNPGAGATNVNELGGGANYGITGAGGAGSAARGGY